MRRLFTTRPGRLTAALVVLAAVCLVVSFLIPGTPGHPRGERAVAQLARL